MAERSFKQEVKKLRLGAGEEFRGEGILAVTKALLQAGVSYVSGYQGAPISHLVDVLADANDVLQELGIRFEASANEAAAAATLAASINYPLRGAATFKATVGTNVASDALANLASSGVTGGALIIVGEDYGEGSSIMQERTHAWASGFLSGLLISYELATMQKTLMQTQPTTIIGEAHLASLYQRVFSARGVSARVLDGAECALRGLTLLRDQRK